MASSDRPGKEKRDDKTPKPPAKVTLSRILKLAWPERWSLLGGTLFLAIGSATNLAFPQAIGVMIDGALEASAKGLGLSKIDDTAMILGGVFAVQGIAIALRFVLFAQSGERVVNKLRSQLFESLMNQDTAFFDGQKTGELSNRLSADTTVLQGAVSANISMGLRNIALVVGALVMLLITSPTLTVLMLAVVPPVAVSAVIYGRRVRKLAKEVQDFIGEGE